MRVIGGEWRSRKVSFASTEDLRPTADRVRETLFNWLQFDIVGARCLDLFAGSGALGIEAASRGAKSVLSIESNIKACSAIGSALRDLQAQRVQLICADVMSVLSSDPEAPFDIVFVDPPFNKGLVAETLELLEDHGWVVAGSKVYLEMEAVEPLADLPCGWDINKSGQAGEVAYYLCGK